MTDASVEEVNTSFSAKLPGLMLGVDSHALGEAKHCPRKFKLAIIDGWQPRERSVHLTFGLLIHRAKEHYDKKRFLGASHDEALDWVVDDALRATWNKALQRPWISGDPNKNRVGLIRAIVWYLEQFKKDPIQTLVLADGSPAVELDFAFDTGLKASTGEPWILCGRMDRIGALGEYDYIVDTKSTKKTLGSYYFAQFTPDNQFSLYVLAGKVVFGKPTKGLILDAIQVGTDFVRCQRVLVPRPAEVIEEWWRELPYWLEQINRWAYEGSWPGNDKVCGLYGGCQFREVCSRPPSAREAWLKANFVKRVWDPLNRREDV